MKKSVLRNRKTKGWRISRSGIGVSLFHILYILVALETFIVANLLTRDIYIAFFCRNF